MVDKYTFLCRTYLHAYATCVCVGMSVCECASVGVYVCVGKHIGTSEYTLQASIHTRE